jgi:hypothetical protein
MSKTLVISSLSHARAKDVGTMLVVETISQTPELAAPKE